MTCNDLVEVWLAAAGAFLQQHNNSYDFMTHNNLKLYVEALYSFLQSSLMEPNLAPLNRSVPSAGNLTLLHPPRLWIL